MDGRDGGGKNLTRGRDNILEKDILPSGGGGTDDQSEYG